MQDPIHGEVADGYGAVADAFRRNFAHRKELGAAIAVVCDGEMVVDLWGGHRDKKRTKPWERDTLAPVFSTTKGMAATAMAVAHSRGLFDLDARVATYWPEFAQGGKDDVTVRNDRRRRHHHASLARPPDPLAAASAPDESEEFDLQGVQHRPRGEKALRPQSTEVP